MFCQATRMCLQSLTFLVARGNGSTVLSSEIGEKLGISPTYVTKILQPLGRKGWLRSFKGRAGGWVLFADPARVTLLEVINALEPDASWKRCIAGYAICSDASACPFHETWSEAVASFEETMQATTLDSLSGFAPPGPEEILLQRGTRKRVKPGSRSR